MSVHSSVQGLASDPHFQVPINTVGTGPSYTLFTSNWIPGSAIIGGMLHDIVWDRTVPTDTLTMEIWCQYTNPSGVQVAPFLATSYSIAYIMNLSNTFGSFGPMSYYFDNYQGNTNYQYRIIIKTSSTNTGTCTLYTLRFVPYDNWSIFMKDRAAYNGVIQTGYIWVVNYAIQNASGGSAYSVAQPITTGIDMRACSVQVTAVGPDATGGTGSASNLFMANVTGKNATGYTINVSTIDKTGWSGWVDVDVMIYALGNPYALH